jgi:hypothetical protein
MTNGPIKRSSSQKLIDVARKAAKKKDMRKKGAGALKKAKKKEGLKKFKNDPEAQKRIEKEARRRGWIE